MIACNAALLRRPPSGPDITPHPSSALRQCHGKLILHHLSYTLLLRQVPIYLGGETNNGPGGPFPTSGTQHRKQARPGINRPQSEA